MSAGDRHLKALERSRKLRPPTEKDLPPKRKKRIGAGPFVYNDEDGRPYLLHYHKGVWERWDDGEWVTGAKGRTPYLYNLDRLVTNRATATILIGEGEKVCDYLHHALPDWELFVPTTTGGAKTWNPDRLLAYFVGANVVCFPDNDDAGRGWLADVAGSVARVARSVRLVDPRDHLGLEDEGADVADWLRAGHTASELMAVIAAAPAYEDTNELVDIGEVEERRIRWLWKGFIPIGKWTILAGDGGLGKSLITQDLAARLVTGDPWAFTEKRHNRGRVLILSSEDAADDTLKPRLRAAGVDMDDPDVTARIRVSPTLDMEKWKLPDGLGRIERAIKDFRREVKGGRTLVILDPLTSFLPAKMDSNATVAVRQALDRLAAFADRNQIALVVITHINKKPDLHPLHRIVGSGQFGAATRSALIVGPEPDQPPDLEPEDRTFILTQAKTNIAKPESYRYGVTDKRLVVEGKPVTYPLLDWMDADAGVYAMALLASPSRKVAQDGREPSKSESAREWLRRTLADGPLKKSEIILAGLKETPPFGTRLLENAADAIGVSRKQLQVGGDSEWKLPATPK